MTGRGAVAIEPMDGPAAVRAQDAFRLVYAEAFAGPPYHETEDGRRTFGLMEIAVRGPWRGQGVARALHTALLDGIGAERVLLNVHPANRAATAAYRAWGYRKVGETRPGGGAADLHDVMLLDLPGPA
ncbi:GNAT family N-acetyltransferase [Streptomyces sp. NPDC020472]|uniref:GNAT family N-acetyltransferase n=1 Tax=Streptomyces sp. NPDC020472 TaxID=3365075 RepID=UPI0037A20AE7